jgi:outer membrane receptor protein involved in Fe transport
MLALKKKILLSAMMVLASLIALPPFVLAGTVGKISGKIVNEETGEPLPGVAVSIVGSKMGALTDENGEYFILNVPVGVYTLRASLIGFAPVEVTNVNVSVDLVTYSDFSLSKKALELGKTIVVTAERPMVIKDKTTTVNITSGDDLRVMPVRGFEQLVGIQNSVVRMNSNVDIRQRGGRESLAMAPEINLRGGRPSEVAYYVDGFSQQDPLSGNSTANINNNAIEEVAVTSGAFSAEYGHVASGIVNVTTRSGSDKYQGNVEAVTDNILIGDSYDQNFYTADFGGPIPGMEKSYFFLSGERRWMADRAPSSKTKEVYEKFGLDTLYENPHRMPANWLKGWSYQGKLNFELAENMKLIMNGNGSIDNWQEYRHYYLNPTYPTQVNHCPRYKDKNLGLNATMTHTLNPKTFYDMSVSYFLTERIRGDGVLFDDYAAYKRELANPEYDRHDLFRQGDSIFASDLGLIPADSAGTEIDTFVTFYDSYWNNFLHRKSSYIGLKGDLTSQLTSSNITKFGFDFQRHTLRYFENLDATALEYSIDLINRYGYDSLAEESDDLGFMNETKHPINLGVYVQNRFEWREFIVNAGLRFDYFDYKSLRVKNLVYPFDPSGGTDDQLDREDLEDSKKFTRLSPRLGVSFPVSDATQLHINYGKFYQRPDLVNLYVGYDFMEARVDGGSYYPFPSPNLEPEEITQYEFGINHKLGDNTMFEIVAYYKDVSGLTQIFHQSPAYPKVYDFYSNMDYGTIKGFDFNLASRRTRRVSYDIKYSWSMAMGTGSYAQSTFNIAWKNSQGIPKTTNPLDYDQRHSIIGIFDFRTRKGDGPMLGNTHPLENFNINFVIQVASGTPYTPMRIYDEVSPNASVQQIPTGSINSANLPWKYVVDLRLERSFMVGKYKMTPYVWVKNLLDRDNVLSVYEGTGQANTSGYLETPEGQTRASEANYGDEFAYRYSLAQFNPKNYANPRMIYLGLRLSF